MVFFFQECDPSSVVFFREEDEFSELRSELSHSQQEVNEDGQSVDLDQSSVSVPENQSTLVTADMGEIFSAILIDNFDKCKESTVFQQLFFFFLL